MVRSRGVASDLPSVDLRPNLAAERDELLAFLSGLSEDERRAETACVGWARPSALIGLGEAALAAVAVMTTRL